MRKSNRLTRGKGLRYNVVTTILSVFLLGILPQQGVFALGHGSLGPQTFRVWVSSEVNANLNESNGAMTVFDGVPPNMKLVEIDSQQKKSHHPWISPDGKHIFGDNRKSASLTAYNPDTLAVEAVIPVGTDPTHMQWNKDSRYAYVGNTATVAAGGGYVSVIDVVNNVVVAEVPANMADRRGGTHDSTITPDGQYVYFANNKWNSLYKISTDPAQGFPLVQEIEVGVNTDPTLVKTQGIRIHPSGDKLYAVNVEGSVTVVKLNYGSPDTVIKNIDITNGVPGPGSHNPRISPDGKWVYVGNRSSGQVVVIDTSTDTVVKFIDAGAGANTPEFTKDGRYNVVTNQSADFVSVIDVRGSLLFGIAPHTEIAEIPTGLGPHNVRFSPDGNFAFATCKNDSVVSVINMRTLSFVQNLNVAANPNGIIIEPRMAIPPKVNGFWRGKGTSDKFVFLFGENFIPGKTQVSVNGVSAPLTQVQDDSLLIFLLPPGDTVGPITVDTFDGSASSATDFGAALTGLQVTGIWPAQGSAGTLTFVFGSEFIPGSLGSTEVSLNGTTAPLTQVQDDTLLIFMVPPSATTGSVTVTTMDAVTSNINTVISGTNFFVWP